VFAQTTNGIKVPDAVTHKFKTLFPNVDTVKWEKRDWTSYSANSYLTNLNYGADFRVNHEYSWAKFDSTGEKTYVHVDLSYDSLPLNTLLYLNKKYKKHLPSEKYWELDQRKRRYYRYMTYGECMIIDSGVKYFCFHLGHHTRIKIFFKEYTLLFDSDGKFLERHVFHTF